MGYATCIRTVRDDDADAPMDIALHPLWTTVTVLEPDGQPAANVYVGFLFSGNSAPRSGALSRMLGGAKA